MCGIAGKLLFSRDGQVGQNEIEAMLAPMAHRGPDGHGVHLDGPVGLGHLRLAIIDVDGGPQPMTNEDGSVWIVFNGEIYNFQSLREGLIGRGHTFKSHCDTEVIIHLYEEYGAECVKHLRGMFAFAIWDQKRRRLFAARDRVGIKPLYYCQTSSALFFASELKAIITDPSVPRTTDPEALRTFFSFYFLPGEATLFSNIKKLLPGHTLTVENGNVSVERYWNLEFNRDRASRSFNDVVEELYAMLGSTVRDHMIADVPVGVLLSGGVDSSAILKFAVEGTAKKVRTYTIGFDGADVVDERPYARLAAKRFGTEQHELTISADDFWDFLPKYAWHMEDPVCEPPAVALYYISKLARQDVKVLLSGEGGDEAFAGYATYPNQLNLERWGRRLGIIAAPTGAAAALAGDIFGSDRARRCGAALGSPLVEHYFSRTSSPATLFNRKAHEYFTPDFTAASKGASPVALMKKIMAPAAGWPLLDQMLFADTNTWLPDDLLTKADKITMANSVELRVPLLDHQILEFAATLPAAYKTQGKSTKRALKAAFSRVLPPEVINRKKAGFPVPYSAWLRGPLAARVREALLAPTAANRSWFKAGKVEEILRKHEQTGIGSKEVFSILITELWHQTFLRQKPVVSQRPLTAGTR
ncbi:MAG: asparagine synthase (glutamine-hydrolyzing) [Opitutus sp.]